MRQFPCQQDVSLLAHYRGMQQSSICTQLKTERDILLWLEDYLKCRAQIVVLNGTRSTVDDDLTSEVPQGSVLGPLLFLIDIKR